MKTDTARCNPSALFFEFKNQTSAQLRLREENMGELDPIPCENDFPLRIRFEAGFEIRNLSDSKEVSLLLFFWAFLFLFFFFLVHVICEAQNVKKSSSEKIEITCGAVILEIISCQLEVFLSEVGTAFRCRKAQKRMTKVWLLRIAFTWAEGL